MHDDNYDDGILNTERGRGWVTKTSYMTMKPCYKLVIALTLDDYGKYTHSSRDHAITITCNIKYILVRFILIESITHIISDNMITHSCST